MGNKKVVSIDKYRRKGDRTTAAGDRRPKKAIHSFLLFAGLARFLLWLGVITPFVAIIAVFVKSLVLGGLVVGSMTAGLTLVLAAMKLEDWALAKKGEGKAQPPPSSSAPDPPDAA